MKRYTKEDHTSLKVIIADLSLFNSRFHADSTADLAKLTLNVISRIPGSKLPETIVRDELLRARRGLEQLTEMVELMLEATSDVESTEHSEMTQGEMIADLLAKDKEKRSTRH
jgi:hypothetical protein